MSEIAAVQDVTKTLDCERMNRSTNNGQHANSKVESMDRNADKKNETEITLVGDPVKEAAPPEDSTNSEIEYTDSEDLNDVENVETSVQKLLAGLESKDWVLVCDALNHVRRLSIFHKESMISMLNNVITLVVKSIKNPRSAVCKTAIMTSADIFKAYKDGIIESLDPLLVQLLLKASQDKKFVCEAAERSLITLTSEVSPVLLLPKLIPYVKNKNPRIRAKASMCISRSVLRLGVEGVEAFGIEKLMGIGASQLSDQLPESRDAARALLIELKSLYEKANKQTDADDDHSISSCSWEDFCESKLAHLSAQAALRVTSTARDGVSRGS